MVSLAACGIHMLSSTEFMLENCTALELQKVTKKDFIFGFICSKPKLDILQEK